MMEDLIGRALKGFLRGVMKLLCSFSEYYVRDIRALSFVHTFIDHGKR